VVTEVLQRFTDDELQLHLALFN